MRERPIIFRGDIDNETREAIIKASAYEKRHMNHVYQLVKESSGSIRPGREDLMRPELWKGIHWSWYHMVMRDLRE